MIFYLDTNCILRFLTNDIPPQAEQIEKRLKKIQESDNDKVYVPHIVIIETMFQLERWYKLSQLEAAEKMLIFLSPNWIEVDQKSHVLSAIEQYKNNSVDLVDIFIYYLARGAQSSILSFDKDFDRFNPRLRQEP